MVGEKLARSNLLQAAARTGWSAGRYLIHGTASVTSGPDESITGEPSFDPSLSTGTTGTESNYARNDPPTSPTPAGRNPVLTGRAVTDYGSVDFIADPFLYPGQNCWHLFFEVFNHSRDPPAVIGHATSRDGGFWSYEGIVLNTGEHLSFPFVFDWNDNQYMIPEEGAGDGRTVRIYRATAFPDSWRHVATPVRSTHRTDDSVVFRWEDRWWLLIGDAEDEGINIYTSDSLETNDWRPHRDNPVVTDRPHAYRPGGRPIAFDDRVVVFFQDCEQMYGHRVRAYDITALSRDLYQDVERPGSPVLEGAGGTLSWNAGRMHHIDPWFVDGRWFCAVDGNISPVPAKFFTARHWSIGTYTA